MRTTRLFSPFFIFLEKIASFKQFIPQNDHHLHLLDDFKNFGQTVLIPLNHMVTTHIQYVATIKTGYDNTKINDQKVSVSWVAILPP